MCQLPVLCNSEILSTFLSHQNVVSFVVLTLIPSISERIRKFLADIFWFINLVFFPHSLLEEFGYPPFLHMAQIVNPDYSKPKVIVLF